ncbi:hypothetical protein UFOVP53_120 [uncultured Caudovirales phage]|uniref:Uncharacterized protein n=1 Tax=uncultured Caudovirales phage TaxID=2100421 RepID=A0A6J5KWI9_9CAUD|nr:hypothetical protein UFOVP53_120 [uncultured Caudovirales phage]
MEFVSQKDSVVNEVKAILGSNFSSSVSVRDQLTDDQLDIIKNNVFQGIINGSISYTKELSDEKEVFKYASGMVSNYLRKAKELNGGVTYVPSATTSGSRDAQLSELNKLLKSYTEGSDEFNQISEAVEARKAAITLEKTSTIKEKKKSKEFESINMDALPEGLKNLASSLVNQISK